MQRKLKVFVDRRALRRSRSGPVGVCAGVYQEVHSISPVDTGVGENATSISTNENTTSDTAAHNSYHVPSLPLQGPQEEELHPTRQKGAVSESER